MAEFQRRNCTFLSDNDCIREINLATSEINAFVGFCANDMSGRGTTDGIGPSARFDEPTSLTTDGTNLYVADTLNHTIRKIRLLTGEVTTIAGNATVGVPGTNDGPIGVALLSYPLDLVYDPTHGLLMSSGKSRADIDVTAIRRIH